MAKISQKDLGYLRKRLLESAEVKTRVAQDCSESILAAVQMIVDTFKSGGKIMICGNGGSAADAQHMAAEFVCVLDKTFDRPGLPAFALTTDTSILTAHANDLGFEKIFKRQVQALGKPGDTLIGISTSGNSSNIINAVEAAKQAKIKTIVLTGTNGKLKQKADVAISVPSNNTQYIQESHLAIEHAVCELVESNFFDKNRKINKQWS